MRSEKYVGVALVGVALALFASAPRAAVDNAGVLAQVDHLVYTVPDLQVGIDSAEKLFGVKATPGGQHPGLGTRNALIALGPASYFEIIGPDPDQPKPAGPRRFGIDWGTSPHPSATAAKGVTLVGLRAEHPDAERVQKMLKQLGLDLAVTRGPKPALVATFDSPKGRVELRSEK